MDGVTYSSRPLHPCNLEPPCFGASDWTYHRHHSVDIIHDSGYRYPETLETMRPLNIAASLVASGVLLTSHAQLIPFLSKPSSTSDDHRLVDHQKQLQEPMNAHNPGIQLPPSSGDDSNGGDGPSNPGDAVILSDVIGTQRNINIFAGFTRDIDSIAKRLDTASQNTTVLAPRNSAVTALPRKPWEDPMDYARMGAEAYTGSDGEDRAHANLRRFTEAHIIPASPWKEGERVKSLAGGSLWWERKDGKAIIQPGGIEVESVANRVANGEVWVIKDVINYRS